MGQMVPAHVRHKCFIFQMNFQQLLLKADFLDFAPLRCVYDSHGLAHMPIWCRQKCYIFRMNVERCAFACHVGFKSRAVTIGLGHIYTQLDLLQGARVHEITPFQFIYIFPMYLQWFHVNVLCCFSKVHKMRASRSQLDTLHGPRVHEISLCVAYAASRFGTNFRALSQRPKYVMFSATFGAPVLQTTLCVAFAARRVCVLLGRPDSKM